MQIVTSDFNSKRLYLFTLKQDLTPFGHLLSHIETSYFFTGSSILFSTILVLSLTLHLQNPDLNFKSKGIYVFKYILLKKTEKFMYLA